MRNTIKKVREPGVILNRLNPIRQPRTYIIDINGKVYYGTREHLKPRINSVSREMNEYFEPPTQVFMPIPSTSTDVPSVNPIICWSVKGSNTNKDYESSET